MDPCVAAAIARFGADLKPKLDGSTIDGAPEDQLRAPTETLIRDLALCCGLPASAVHLVGETTLAELKSRPDYAVVVSGALVGYIEIKAPEKGADPRRFRGEHDKAQWARLKALPNILYTSGNGFSLWQDGELQGGVVQLDGDVATSGAKLKAPDSLLPLINDFRYWVSLKSGPTRVDRKALSALPLRQGEGGL